MTTNMTEVSNFDAGIYQIQTTDAVIGGPTGISNLASQSLANRTRFLLNRILDGALNYAVDTGTANAYVANVTGAPTAYVDGAEFSFKAGTSNTGAATFTPNNVLGALSPVQMYAGDGAALQGGEIIAGGSYRVRFNQSLNGGAGGVVIIAQGSGIVRSATPNAGDMTTAAATMAAVFTAADGMAAVNVSSGANVVLTQAQYGCAMLRLTGTPTASINLIFPAQTGHYVVINNQTGAQNVTAITSASGSTGVVIPQGVATVLYSDGTNMGVASASGTAAFRTVPITGVTGTTLTVSGGYTPGNILIEKNGTLLEPTTGFTASNGATVTLVNSAVSTDKFNVYAFSTFAVANALTLAGGAMSGAVALAGGDTGGTAAQFDNSTKLASTAFVQRALGHYSSVQNYASTATIPVTQTGSVIECGASTPITLTLPAPGAQNYSFVFHNYGTSTLTLSTPSGNFNGSGLQAVASTMTLNPGQDCAVVSDGINYCVISLSFPSGSFSANGYQKMPSGLIIQWGAAVVSASLAATPITLPIAYPNGQLYATSSYNGPSAGGNTCAATATSKTIITLYNSAATPLNQFWFSVGY